MSSIPPCVLVLGTGGNVGQGILKALAHSSLRPRVISACTSARAMGLYMAERAYVSPWAVAPDFLTWLLDLCRAEKVDIVLSGVEEVLEQLGKHASEIRESTGALCVVSSSAVLGIAHDKLETCRWLKQEGFHFPEFADGGDPQGVERLVARAGFPLVVKPRRGKGSQGVALVRSASELARWSLNRELIVQQYLPAESSEYTVGCFVDSEGQLHSCMSLRRELNQGTTSFAELDQHPAVLEEAGRIATRLGPMGPCNIQMRLHQGRAVTFEINARFSGTTPVRARLGFNEVEAALRHFGRGEALAPAAYREDLVALRYWNELYVPRAALEQLESTRSGIEIRKGMVFPEDFGGPC